MNRCLHIHKQGVRKGERCDEKVSKVDPEKRYCAHHRVCVFIIQTEDKVKVQKEEIKYINYETFCASIVCGAELNEAKLLFN